MIARAIAANLILLTIKFKIMNKIIIKEANGKLYAHIDKTIPKFLENDTEHMIAAFDVSECFIHIN